MIYREVDSIKYCSGLQRNIYAIDESCSDWQLSLNVKKYVIMRITKSSSPLTFFYTIGEVDLTCVAESRHLDVTIESNLPWNSHVWKAVGQTNSNLRFVGWILRDSTRETKEVVHKVLVRPHFSYWCSIWDPYTRILAYDFDMMQKRAARFVFNNYSRFASVSVMLENLEWGTLRERRSRFRMNLLDKFVKEVCQNECREVLLPPTYTISRRDRPDKFRDLSARSSSFQFSLLSRTVRKLIIKSN